MYFLIYMRVYIVLTSQFQFVICVVTYLIRSKVLDCEWVLDLMRDSQKFHQTVLIVWSHI